MKRKTYGNLDRESLAAILLFLTVWLFFSYAAYPLTERRILRRLDAAYANLQRMAPEEYSSLEEAESQDFPEELEGISFVICRENLEIVAENGNADSPERLKEKLRRNTAYFREDAKAVRHSGPNGEMAVIFGKTSGEGETCYVYLHQNLRTLQRNYQFLRRILWVLMPLLCGLTLLLLAARNIRSEASRRSIEEELRRLGSGDDSPAEVLPRSGPEWETAMEAIRQVSDRMRQDRMVIQNYSYLTKERLKDQAELDDMQKKLVSQITHQLKTPLAIISSQVELDHEEKDPEKKEYYYQSILEEIDKMSLLIRDILKNYRNEYGSRSAGLRRTELTGMLEDLCPKYESWLTSCGIIFRAEVEKDVIVRADPEQLEQAVHNYIMNAVSHTRKGRTVRLTLTRADGECEISVHNEGDGIPEEDLNRIWDPWFHRGNAGSGMEAGLGLYIVKDIVRQHGGTCGVYNEKTGVRFWIRLPEYFLKD